MNINEAKPSDLFELACQYMSDGETEKAIPLLRKAADEGHVFAASNLGICFYFGDGVKQSYEEAFSCFQIAQADKDPTAFYYLARMYRFGEGRKPDIRAALEYYTKAAMAGMPEAQCELAELYTADQSVGIERDLRRAIHWFAYAAQQGNAEAESQFNMLYYHGHETTEQPTGFWFERESLENRKIPCSEPFSVLVDEGEYVAEKQPLEIGVRKRTASETEAFDLDFRPRSYWGPQHIGTWIGSHVKGELRKRQALKDAGVDHFDPEIISESLSDEHRAAVGRVHPWFMGGEYLPSLLENEVEIARITTKSTTMDVISIRARKEKHRILYRIVDEYDSAFWEEQYSLTKKTSINPLSLRELIELIDNACEGGLVGAGREANYAGSDEELKDPDDYYDFETASSAYYPELERWYDTLNEKWLRNERKSLPRRQQEKRERLAAEIAAIRIAAEKDDPAALTDLGYSHFLGRGVEQSREKAVEFWKRASELGDPSGTLNLATCLRDGIGVAPDQKQALELYERLAEGRFYPGLQLAGYCRHVGIGCEPDREKALRWYFELAKAAGKNVFSDDLVNCLRNMDGGSIIEKEAIDWIREAAELGPAGQNMLAKLAGGKTEDPVKHNAGLMWLSGSRPLRKLD